MICAANLALSSFFGKYFIMLPLPADMYTVKAFVIRSFAKRVCFRYNSGDDIGRLTRKVLVPFKGH
jgi:hypothetical protein